MSLLTAGLAKSEGKGPGTSVKWNSAFLWRYDVQLYPCQNVMPGKSDHTRYRYCIISRMISHNVSYHICLLNLCFYSIPLIYWNTVDGRNPAPPVIYETLWKMGYSPYQLVSRIPSLWNTEVFLRKTWSADKRHRAQMSWWAGAVGCAFFGWSNLRSWRKKSRKRRQVILLLVVNR